jgi:hypothetical protein
MPTRLEGDVYISGNLQVGAGLSVPANTLHGSAFKADAEIDRDQMAQDPLKVFPVPMTDFRVWDAVTSLLPATGGTDDLGLYTGTFGTDSPNIKTGDVKAAGAVTRRARVQIPLPMEYEDGETVQLRLKAGMQTTVADVSATIDVEVYRIERDGTVGADLCGTAAQSINSLTLADKTFDIDEATLVTGDILDVRVTIATNDAATATAVIAMLVAMELLADVRG